MGSGFMPKRRSRREGTSGLKDPVKTGIRSAGGGNVQSEAERGRGGGGGGDGAGVRAGLLLGLGGAGFSERGVCGDVFVHCTCMLTYIH